MPFRYWMLKGWYNKGQYAGRRGTYGSAEAAWNKTSGKPKTTSKRMDAWESFYAGFYDVRYTPKRNPLAKNAGWIKAQAIRIRRDSRGRPTAVDLKVRRGTKIRNIEGYVDAEGRFRPIRGSKGYQQSKSQKPGVRVARARGKGWTYRKTKKGWMARGPRGGRYGPYRTKKAAMKGRK